jgi:hypothetical protein
MRAFDRRKSGAEGTTGLPVSARLVVVPANTGHAAAGKDTGPT